jgi:L-asparaginase II
MQTFPIIAEYVRSGFVEGRHYGSLVAVDADGAVTIAVGAPEEPMLPRSANKPLLAVGMLGARTKPRPSTSQRDSLASSTAASSRSTPCRHQAAGGQGQLVAVGGGELGRRAIALPRIDNALGEVVAGGDEERA